MTTRTTTPKLNSVKLSNKANLNLNVTTQDEIKALVEDFRGGVAATKSGFGAEVKKLASRKRDALYGDLAAASAIAQILLRDANADAYLALLDDHGLDPVLDPSKRNEFVPVCRLLWGWWPEATKAQKEAHEDVPFTWDRSVELYAKVLRGATILGVQPGDLAKELASKGGLKAFKDADDKKHLKNDEGEKERQRQYKALLNEPPAAVISVTEVLGIKSKDVKEQSFVALLCQVSADGQTLKVVARMKDKHAALDAKAYEIAREQSQAISMRAKDREIAELKAERGKRVGKAVDEAAETAREMLSSNDADAA